MDENWYVYTIGTSVLTVVSTVFPKLKYLSSFLQIVFSSQKVDLYTTKYGNLNIISVTIAVIVKTCYRVKSTLLFYICSQSCLFVYSLLCTVFQLAAKVIVISSNLRLTAQWLWNYLSSIHHSMSALWVTMPQVSGNQPTEIISII